MSTHVGYSKTGRKLTAFEHGVSGAISGVIARAVVQPLDVLKIRLQLQIEPTLGKSDGLYRGLLSSTKTIFCNEGITALWKGHIPAQILTVTYGVGQFTSYYLLTSLTKKSDIEKNGKVQLMCGGLAGMIGTIMSMPCDVVRTRIVAQSVLKYRNLFDAWCQMFRQEGVLSFWKGLGPTLVMTMPAAAIQFRIYHLLLSCYPGSDGYQCKDCKYNAHKRCSEKVPKDCTGEVLINDETIDGMKGHLSRSAICGTGAGVIAKIVVYPLDVLKKRFQIMGAETTRSNFGKVTVYNSAFHCIKQIFIEEGPLGWYKGLWPSLIKSGLFSGIVFCAYECVCHVMLKAHDLYD